MARKFAGYTLNARTISAPLTAFIMAGLLYVYSRTAIRSAKSNAQRHREADGGQISWRNETLRRHGVLERPADEGLVWSKTGAKGEQVAGPGAGGGGESGNGAGRAEETRGGGKVQEEKERVRRVLRGG